jgi:molybdopterin/thiamine biosynthesis adenylyltransferase/rhodanese-related sulfurtransferase
MSHAPPSDEALRYGRQTLLPEIGMDGQNRLREASVLVVGVGGLGTPVATYLAAAGVGRIGLVDDDTVDVSNLHRQPLYTAADVGRLKVEVAAERLALLNPYVRVETHPVRLDAGNAERLVGRYDVVADGTDTFGTRYLVNDACVRTGRPNAFASVSQFAGQAAVFGGRLHDGGQGPCYRCLFPDPPSPGTVPSCAEGGVLGVLPGLLGTIQATEVLKLILGVGDPLVGRLLLVDALSMAVRTLRIDRDRECPVCGDHAVFPPLTDTAAACGPAMSAVPEITVTDLKARIDAGARPFVLDVRQPEEYEAANIDGALIPLGELPDRIGELESHREDDLLVVHCRSGSRSARAVEFLQSQGFENAVNLTGGIHAWSDQIDPSLPKP